MEFKCYMLTVSFVCLYLAGFYDGLPEGQRGVLERALPHRPDSSPRSVLSPWRHPRTQGRTQAFHCSQVNGFCECTGLYHFDTIDLWDRMYFIFVPFCILGILRARMCCWRVTSPPASLTLDLLWSLRLENQQETHTDRYSLLNRTVESCAL